MLRPLLLVAALLGTLFGGVRLFQTRHVFSDVYGRPLDHAGPKVACPRCDNPLANNIRGYDYRCAECEMQFHCRLDEVNRRYEYDPDPRTPRLIRPVRYDQGSAAIRHQKQAAVGPL
jgi:hypothetical protein